MTPIRLAPADSPALHPCAAASLYGPDLALLHYLVQDLRALVRRAAGGQVELMAYEPLTWEVHGLRRRTVICDPDRLMIPGHHHVVGFFGDRRVGVDLVALEAVEIGLLAEFRNYPGIMSYSSVELVDDQWANLVVHAKPGDREAWRGSEAHVHAVQELAPDVYHSVRIHNGCLVGGVIGSATPVIASTKYWDYDVTPVWHAERVLPTAAVERAAGRDATAH